MFSLCFSAAVFAAGASVTSDSRTRFYKLPLTRIERRPINVAEFGSASTVSAASKSKLSVQHLKPTSLSSKFPVVIEDQAATPVWLDEDVTPLLLTEDIYNIDVDNVGNLFYMVEAEVGTPGQTVRLVIDTGSSDIWTRSGYSPQNSSSVGKREFPPVHLAYGIGDVSGQETSDKICFGDFCAEDVTIVVADDVESIGNQGLFDGIIGLAFPGLSKTTQKSLLQQLQDAGRFNTVGYGLCLFSGSSTELINGSMLTIGEVQDLKDEAAHVTGSDFHVTLPVVGFPTLASREPVDMFWTIRMSIAMDFGGGWDLIAPRKVTALDSGTSLIAIPPQDYERAMDALLGDDGMARFCSDFHSYSVCDCDTPVQNLSFVLGEGSSRLKVTLTAEDLFQDVSDLVGIPNICRFAFIQGPASLPFWILGDVFLRKVYMVHDYGNATSDASVSFFAMDGTSRQDLTLLDMQDTEMNQQLTTIIAVVSMFLFGIVSYCSTPSGIFMWKPERACACQVPSANSLPEVGYTYLDC